MPNNPPHNALRHHVTGAIERGEKTAIVEKRATVRTITGAAYWASYLINGDDSGLDASERALCDAWMTRELEPGESIVSCDDEPRFTWSYGLHTGADCAGGDVLDYTVIKI